MGKRRKIRETAVQLLYCAHQRGGRAPEDLREAFWRLVSEPDRRRFLTATLRAIRQTARQHPARLDAWSQRMPAARAAAAADPDAAPLLDAIDRVAAAESRLAAALESLRRLPLDGDDDEITPRLESAVDAFFAAHDRARAERRRFLEATEDFPALLPKLEPLAGAARKLNRISERIEALRQPKLIPEGSESARVRESHEDLAAVREQTDRFIDRVLSQLETIDARIEAIVENFSPERIDPVDRAILRLAAWEILFDPEIPAPVAINEAVEIAKRFGTVESARFVNGILDHMAKEEDTAAKD
jgi:N utilization substance protein B